jgi:hypothetical protein
MSRALTYRYACWFRILDAHTWAVDQYRHIHRPMLHLCGFPVFRSENYLSRRKNNRENSNQHSSDLIYIRLKIKIKLSFWIVGSVNYGKPNLDIRCPTDGLCDSLHSGASKVSRPPKDRAVEVISIRAFEGKRRGETVRNWTLLSY